MTTGGIAQSTDPSESPYESSGYYGGFSLGTWQGLGGNRALGNPILGGIHAEIRGPKAGLAFSFNLIYSGATPETIEVTYNDSSQFTNEFNGGLIELRYVRELLSSPNERWTLDGTAGLGYTGISYWQRSLDALVEGKSGYVSPGLLMRGWVTPNHFIMLEVNYQLMSLHPETSVSHNLRGNFLVFRMTTPLPLPRSVRG